jgi:hypothetical protein
MVDSSFLAILLGFFIVVIGVAYLLFDFTGAIIGACLYLSGTIYSTICSRKQIGLFKETED